MKKPAPNRLTLAQVQQSIRSQMPHDQDMSKLPAFMFKEPRKASQTPRKHEEHDLQIAIVAYLRAQLPDAVIAAGLTGELWSMARFVPKGIFYGWMGKLKRRGMLTGQPDLTVYLPDRQTLFLEVKRPDGGGNASEAQKRVLERLAAFGSHCHVVQSVEEVVKIVEGLLTSRNNT